MADHPVVHLEISAQNPQALSSFYADAFGWRIEVAPEFDYTMFDATGGPGGGFPKVDGSMFKSGDILPYIGTDDIDATLARIKELGGEALHSKMEIPGMGWIAWFRDPSGNRMGLWQGTGRGEAPA